MINSGRGFSSSWSTSPLQNTLTLFPLMSIFRIIPILGTRMTRSVFSISKAKAKSGTVATLAKHLINLGA